MPAEDSSFAASSFAVDSSCAASRALGGLLQKQSGLGTPTAYRSEYRRRNYAGFSRHLACSGLFVRRGLFVRSVAGRRVQSQLLHLVPAQPETRNSFSLSNSLSLSLSLSLALSPSRPLCLSLFYLLIFLRSRIAAAAPHPCIDAGRTFRVESRRGRSVAGRRVQSQLPHLVPAQSQQEGSTRFNRGECL